jgi:hypothetical protein
LVAVFEIANMAVFLVVIAAVFETTAMAAFSTVMVVVFDGKLFLLKMLPWQRFLLPWQRFLLKFHEDEDNFSDKRGHTISCYYE